MAQQKTQDGITFNSVKNTGGSILSYWPARLQNQIGPNAAGGVINAIDIDWNGAVLPQSSITTGSQITINTTGDLLNLINEMQKEIYVLSAAVIALAGTTN